MKNKFLLISIIVGILIFSSINVMAFMPREHYLVLYNILHSSNNGLSSTYYNACAAYPDLCLASSEELDVGVIWYYLNEGRYNSLHSPTFCAAMVDNIPSAINSNFSTAQAEACIAGCYVHLAEDLPSHGNISPVPDGGMVVYAISHTSLPNSVIHVFAEEKLDLWVLSNNPFSTKEYQNSLQAGYRTCEPLYVQAMLGTSSFSNLSKADLEGYFDTFVFNVVNSQTGYDPAFKDKSFMVTLQSLPLELTAGWVILICFFGFVGVLLLFKIIRRQAKIRHYIGLIIFFGLFAILLYLLIGALLNNLFGFLLNVISPLSNLVPIGNPQSYIDQMNTNVINMFISNGASLSGTDPSGMGINPVLTQATNNVAIYSYIILAFLAAVFIWFIWYILKKDVFQSSNYSGGWGG